MRSRVFVFPGSRPHFVFTSPGSQFVFTDPRFSIRIYRPWLIRIGNNKSQRLQIMLLFLFLLSNSFVTVIVGRNEAKGNLSKKQINRKLTTISQVKQKKKQSEINWIKLKNTKIHLKQVLRKKPLELFRVIIFYELSKMLLLKWFFFSIAI